VVYKFFMKSHIHCALLNDNIMLYVI
jgi:hypothetical protein